MKKIILCTVAGIAIGYFCRKIREKADIKEICDDINDLSYKTRKKFKNVINKGLNEADCVKDQLESKIQ